ncbi:MAG TPA: DUF3089 domain-containing protein [Rhizomicrobium sp.]|nr:DUF3089 domain-containing protein [Rhizomicrobium sp.]
MRTFLRIVMWLVVILVGAGAAIYFTGNTLTVIALIGKPHHGWDMKYKAPTPDYADAKNWAALPSKPGLSAMVPKGVEAAPKDAPVDVFFIHPTGYMSGGDWNSPMDSNTTTEENTRWMMANQASVYNGCCAIYAPRYRETSIYRYFDKSDVADKAREMAYSDVDRAFTYFLEHYSKGRPFIIASHSQGTEHGFRLLRERIDGTPLASLMVAAYLIGFQITDHDAASLKTVHVCDAPTDTHCLVLWATVGEGASAAAQMREEGKLICVNPLTWKRDGGMADKSLNLGAVPQSGQFTPNFIGSDAPKGTVFEPLAAPLPHWTWAACRDGLLTVADQSKGPFAKLDVGGGNYHGMDYALFAMNLRENAKARVAASMISGLRDGPAP